jgi:hypothetical protein
MRKEWEDLSRSPHSIEAPEWHKSILEQRSDRIAGGAAHFVDWEAAKAEIRKSFGEN